MGVPATGAGPLLRLLLAGHPSAAARRKSAERRAQLQLAIDNWQIGGAASSNWGRRRGFLDAVTDCGLLLCCGLDSGPSRRQSSAAAPLRVRLGRRVLGVSSPGCRRSARKPQHQNKAIAIDAPGSAPARRCNSQPEYRSLPSMEPRQDAKRAWPGGHHVPSRGQWNSRSREPGAEGRISAGILSVGGNGIGLLASCKVVRSAVVEGSDATIRVSGR